MCRNKVWINYLDLFLSGINRLNVYLSHDFQRFLWHTVNDGDAGITYFSINHHNFSVLSMEYMVQPWEINRVEFLNFHTQCSDGIEMSFLLRF